jgi:mannose-binding lectin 2
VRQDSESDQKMMYSSMIGTVMGLLCVFSSTTARKLEHVSFEPPFEEVDNAGQRMVGKQWRSAGHAVVNNNFARLTPDRQSKKGALWSRKALGVPEFSGVLKFRISGQGKSFFGDGLALWIVQQSFYDAGDLHGFKENFQGVGIIFDTFR